MPERERLEGCVRGQGVVCENIQNVKIGIDNNFEKKLYIFKNDKG